MNFTRLTKGALASLALVASALLLGACDTTTPRIEGTVTLTSGNGAPKVEVRVYAGDTETLVATATTNSTGAYRFDADDLHPGDYRVAFGQVDSAVWFGDATNWQDAATVHVATDTATGVSIQLDSGTLSGELWSYVEYGPITNGRVSVQHGDTSAEGHTVVEVHTDAAGNFTAELPPGKYRALAWAPGHASAFIAESHTGSATVAGARVIEVQAGAEVPDQDMSMLPGSLIHGFAGDGKDNLAGVEVYAFDAETGGVRSSATTTNAGEFFLDGLGYTEVRVGFFDPQGRVAPRIIGDTNGSYDPADSNGTVYTPPDNFSLDLGTVDLPGTACAPEVNGTVHDFTGSDLTGANLRHCDLAGADLTNVDLTGADLTGADLAFSDLDGADLTGADLREARMAGASLVHTDLAEADLRTTDAVGANFYRSRLDDTRMDGTDLADVRSGGITGRPRALPDVWHLGKGHLIGPGANLTRADLTNAYLSGVVLTSAVLTGAQLDGAHLGLVRSGNIVGRPLSLPEDWTLAHGYLIGPTALLEGADLHGADLSGVNGYGVDLTGADLRGADLTGSDLRYVYLDEADLEGTDLTGADLLYARMKSADLTDATLTSTNLQDADLRNATFDGVRSGGITNGPSYLPNNTWQFSNGYLVGPRAHLEGADLAGFSANTGMQLDGANLAGADLTDANFWDASVIGTDLTGATLDGLSASGDLADAVFADASLTGAMMRNASFVGADFTGADLSGSTLSDSDFSGADFTGANLTDAYLTSANLTGANLTHAVLRDADLGSATMVDARLDYALFERASMYGAKLQGASMVWIDLANVDWSYVELAAGQVYGPIGRAPLDLPDGWIIDDMRNLLHQS